MRARGAGGARRAARVGAVLTMPMPRLLSSIDERERGDAYEQTGRRVGRWEGWRASVGLGFVWLRDAPDDTIPVTPAEARLHARHALVLRGGKGRGLEQTTKPWQ